MTAQTLPLSYSVFKADTKCVNLKPLNNFDTKNKFRAGWAAGKGQRVSHRVIGIYPLDINICTRLCENPARVILLLQSWFSISLVTYWLKIFDK